MFIKSYFMSLLLQLYTSIANIKSHCKFGEDLVGMESESEKEVLHDERVKKSNGVFVLPLTPWLEGSTWGRCRSALTVQTHGPILFVVQVQHTLIVAISTAVETVVITWKQYIFVQTDNTVEISNNYHYTYNMNFKVVGRKLCLDIDSRDRDTAETRMEMSLLDMGVQVMTALTTSLCATKLPSCS